MSPSWPCWLVQHSAGPIGPGAPDSDSMRPRHVGQGHAQHGQAERFASAALVLHRQEFKSTCSFPTLLACRVRSSPFLYACPVPCYPCSFPPCPFPSPFPPYTIISEHCCSVFISPDFPPCPSCCLFYCFLSTRMLRNRKIACTAEESRLFTNPNSAEVSFPGPLSA